MLKFFSFYARFVLAKPKTCLFIALCLIVSFAYLGKDVRLDNNFSSLFSINNEANDYRKFYRQQFDADDAVLIAILQPEIVDKDFFQSMVAISEQLEKNPHFIKVYSPLTSSIVWSDEEAIYVDPLYDKDWPLSIEKMLSLMRESPFTAGRLVSSQSNTFAIVVQMPNNYDGYEKVKAPAEDFKHIVAAHLNDQSVQQHYAGMAFTRVGILGLMLQDLIMLVPITTLVVMLFMYGLFRNHLVVALSLASSVFGVGATVALIGLNNDNINQLTLTFPILIMVIVVANNVHFYHRYFNELKQGKTLEQAVFITTQRIGIASVLSCFTTMIGFYTLMTADMPALFSFGFYVGTGVMLSFFGVMLIVPPSLLLFAPQENTKHSRSTDNNSDKDDAIDRAVTRIISPAWRKWICSLGVVLLLGSAYAASQVKYDYFLSDMLTYNHPQSVASRLMDKELSGALPLEISLLGKINDFKDAKNLLAMQQLSTWLSEQTGSSHWLSLANLVSSLNEAIDGQAIIPQQVGAVEQLLLLAEGSSDDIVHQLVSEDFSHARIKGSIEDIGADTLMQIRDDFKLYAKTALQGTGIKAEMTGELPVYYEGMNQITVELIRSVLFALVLVVLTILLVFRSVSFAIASIFPNILPIVFGLACYSLLGESVNPLPAIALCIGIGIAVDDTVHLFARFNEEIAKGKNSQDAIIDTIKAIKGALISTSTILTAGFFVFFFSAFTWNRELGMLGAILIVLALLADLILTPTILSLQGARRKKLEAE